MTTERLLIVDDDVELCNLVAEYLELDGFAIASAHTGPTGVVRAQEEQFALIVLDVMLPGYSGFEALRQIRAWSDVPVLMLTARGEPGDRIHGLESGADDYLAKPFAMGELTARIRAILRRAGARSLNAADLGRTRLVVDDVGLDFGARLVRKSGVPVEVTSAEFDVLSVLIRSAGQVISREELARGAFGRDLLPFERTLDLHVSHLRRKLGSHRDGLERIRSVRSVGYLYTRASNGG